jgi:hypothetical protein
VVHDPLLAALLERLLLGGSASLFLSTFWWRRRVDGVVFCHSFQLSAFSSQPVAFNPQEFPADG